MPLSKELSDEIEKIVKDFEEKLKDGVPIIERFERAFILNNLRTQLTSLASLAEERGEERYYQPAETVNLTKYQKAYEKGAQDMLKKAIACVDGRLLLFSDTSNMWYRKGNKALYTNSGEIAERENEAVLKILSALTHLN